jgi:hypothetical protein
LALLACSLLGSGCANKDMYGGSYAPMDDSAGLEAEFGYDPLANPQGAPMAAEGMDGSAMPPSPEPGYYEDEADYGEVAEERVAIETVAMADMERGGRARDAFSRAADKREVRRDARKMKTKKSANSASAEPARTEPADIPLEKPEDPGPAVAKDKDTEEPEDHNRQIIYTAAMIVAVHDVIDATERAETIPETYGGYVHHRTEGTLILKVPAKNLRKTMDALAVYGIVQARQLQAQDVTAEYTDLESRIRVLQNTQAQLLDLLKKAKSVEETLRVQQALDQVTMQLETALGRMRQMSDAISFSTLTVRFQQRSPEHHLPSSNDPFKWVDQLGVESTEWR